MRGFGITNNGTLLSSNVTIVNVSAPFTFSQGVNSEVINLNHNLSGVSAGTYNNLSVNTFGLVTSGSNIAYLTSNQNISVTGDATGSGTTSIALTLATVNSTPGTYSVFVVNNKGLVSLGANLTATGDVTGVAVGPNITLTLGASGISAGTYQSVIVNTKGIITAGTTLSSGQITTALGYTPTTPVITTSGTYNTVVINNAGQVIAASNATYGSGSSSVSVILTGAVTGTASSSTGTLTLPTVFSTNGTFSGNLTVLGSFVAGYIDNSIIGYTTPVAGTFTNLSATTQAVVGSGTDGTLFEDNYSTGYLGDIITAKPFFAILRTTGQVGSVNQSNYNSAPVFRNTLDDGTGNFNVPGNATIGTLTISGSISAPTVAFTTNSNIVATTSFVKGQNYLFANGSSGTFNNFIISSTGSVFPSYVAYGGSSSNPSTQIITTTLSTLNSAQVNALIEVTSANSTVVIPSSATIGSGAIFFLYNNSSTFLNLQTSGCIFTGPNGYSNGTFYMPILSFVKITSDGTNWITTNYNQQYNGTTFTYSSGILSSITYTDGSSKNFSYTSGVLSQIYYSSGIVKTFNYTSGKLTSISVSL